MRKESVKAFGVFSGAIDTLERKGAMGEDAAHVDQGCTIAP